MAADVPHTLLLHLCLLIRIAIGRHDRLSMGYIATELIKNKIVYKQRKKINKHIKYLC